MSDRLTTLIQTTVAARPTERRQSRPADSRAATGQGGEGTQSAVRPFGEELAEAGARRPADPATQAAPTDAAPAKAGRYAAAQKPARREQAEAKPATDATQSADPQSADDPNVQAAAAAASAPAAASPADALAEMSAEPPTPMTVGRLADALAQLALEADAAPTPATSSAEGATGGQDVPAEPEDLARVIPEILQRRSQAAQARPSADTAAPRPAAAPTYAPQVEPAVEAAAPRAESAEAIAAEIESPAPTRAAAPVAPAADRAAAAAVADDEAIETLIAARPADAPAAEAEHVESQPAPRADRPASAERTQAGRLAGVTVVAEEAQPSEAAAGEEDVQARPAATAPNGKPTAAPAGPHDAQPAAQPRAAVTQESAESVKRPQGDGPVRPADAPRHAPAPANVSAGVEQRAADAPPQAQQAATVTVEATAAAPAEPSAGAAPTGQTNSPIGQVATAPAAGGVTPGLDASANADRIVQAVWGRFNGRAGGTLHLRLDPPELGVVRVNLSMDGQGVRITLLAADDGAARLLGEGLERLGGALRSHGMNVQHLAIEGPRAQNGGESRQEGRAGGEGQGGQAFDDGRGDDGRGRGGDGRQQRPGGGAWPAATETVVANQRAAGPRAGALNVLG